MTTNTQTIINNQTDPAYETSTFALGVGMTMTALIGIWGTACLTIALVNMGPLNVLQSYFTAVTG